MEECRDYACTGDDKTTGDDGSWAFVTRKKSSPHVDKKPSNVPNIPSNISSSTTIPHSTTSRDVMNSLCPAPSEGVYIHWWTFQRYVSELGSNHNFDMDSMCRDLNTLMRKFAPTLKAKVKFVREAHRGDSNNKFQGYLYVVPTSTHPTEASLTRILEAWSVFIQSKQHERYTVEDGVAAYIPAMRFTIKPTNAPAYIPVGIGLDIVGQWIPDNDALAKSFIMHTFANMARQRISSGSLLSLDSFWKIRKHLGIELMDIRERGLENARGNNVRNRLLLICCSDDPESRRVASNFFAAFRGTNHLPKEVQVFGLLHTKFVIFPPDKIHLKQLQKAGAELVMTKQQDTYVHIIRVSSSFFNDMDNVNESIHVTPDLICMLPRFPSGLSKQVQAACIFNYTMNVRSKNADFYEKHLYEKLPASQPMDTEIIVLDEADSMSTKQTKLSAKDWDTLTHFSTSDNGRYIGVRWGIGGPRAVGVCPYEGPRNAKFLCHNVSYGMENCKAFDNADDAWAWVARAWPGVDSYEAARSLLHMNTGLDMTNLDIHYFPFFNIREVPGDKKGYPYIADDDDDLLRARAFNTFGHVAYDAGCASILFDKYGYANSFQTYETTRRVETSGVKPPPHLTPHDFPPFSVQYQTPPTGGEDIGPGNDTDDRGMPASTTRGDTASEDGRKMPASTTRHDAASRMSIDAKSTAEFFESNTVAESTKDLQGLSLDEDTKLEEPVAKKHRGEDDVVMDVEQHDIDASTSSPPLLSPADSVEDGDSVVSGTQPPLECSQNDRFGLVIFCPPFVTVYDAKAFLDPLLAADSAVIAPCRFEDRFAILVTGASLLIVSLSNTLANMDSLTILGHPIEVETLDSNDWPHVTPLQVNPNAEKLAAQGTVQACKAKCPASQFTPFAEAINNSKCTDDVFAFFLGLLENAKSNDSGTATTA